MIINILQNIICYCINIFGLLYSLSLISVELQPAVDRSPRHGSARAVFFTVPVVLHARHFVLINPTTKMMQKNINFHNNRVCVVFVLHLPACGTALPRPLLWWGWLWREKASKKADLTVKCGGATRGTTTKQTVGRIDTTCTTHCNCNHVFSSQQCSRQEQPCLGAQR